MSLTIFLLILLAACFFLKRYIPEIFLLFVLLMPIMLYPLENLRILNEKVTSCEYKKEIEEINKSSFFIDRNISLDCKKFLVPSKKNLSILYKIARYINIDYNFNEKKEYESSDLVFILKALRFHSINNLYDKNNDLILSKEELENRAKTLEEAILFSDCSIHNIDLNYCDEKEFVANFKRDPKPTFKRMFEKKGIPYYILKDF